MIIQLTSQLAHSTFVDDGGEVCPAGTRGEAGHSVQVHVRSHAQLAGVDTQDCQAPRPAQI